MNKVFIDIRKEVYSDRSVKFGTQDAEVGNRVENYLDHNGELFNVLDPNNIGDTINSSKADEYYTEDTLDIAKDINNNNINNDINNVF